MTAFEDHKSYQNKTLNYYTYSDEAGSGIGTILFLVLRHLPSGITVDGRELPPLLYACGNSGLDV